MDNSTGSSIETFTSSEGWFFKYDKSTNTFGIINNNGGISTYFKPDTGYQYWLDQVALYK